MALDVTPSMHLVWITDSQKDRYLDNLCRSWKDAFDNFYYVPVDAGMNEAAMNATSTIKLLAIKPDEMANYDFYIACNETLSGNYKKKLEGNNLIFYKKTGTRQTGTRFG